ncbi:MAG: hypothetical protein RL417_81 [Pseudomonadota bacterium]|jgi:secreted trypsin-like serine protease
MKLPLHRYGTASFILGLLSVALLAGCGGGGSDGGDDSNSGLSTNACSTLGLNTKIINGTACDTASSPVVEINLYGRDGSIGLCSGTAVQSRYVLTAGHCFLEGGGGSIESASVTAGGGEIFASKVFIHPQYSQSNDGAVFNDVAVLEFPRALNLPTLPVVVNRKVTSDDIVAIYGFGFDESGDFGALKSGEMDVADVTPNHIVSVFGSAGSNTCNGDSGGPAILQFIDDNGQTTTGVVGVTSTGTNEGCTEGDISLFANLQEEPIVSFLRSRVPGIALE